MPTDGSNPGSVREEMHTVVLTTIGEDTPKEWDVQRCVLRGCPAQIDTDNRTISLSKSLNPESQLKALLWRGLNAVCTDLSADESLKVANELARLLWSDGWR